MRKEKHSCVYISWADYPLSLATQDVEHTILKLLDFPVSLCRSLLTRQVPNSLFQRAEKAIVMSVHWIGSDKVKNKFIFSICIKTLFILAPNSEISNSFKILVVGTNSVSHPHRI